MHKKKILLTGGTGFVGLNFIHKYYESFDFYLITRETTQIPSDLGPHIAGTILASELTVEKIKSLKPDYFVHLASSSSFEHDSKSLMEQIESNVAFPASILERYIEAGGRKMINIGTYWQHKDNLDYCPNSIYAASKKAFEEILEYYVANRGGEFITLKLFDTYGKRDPRNRILRLVHEAAVNKKCLELTGGEQLINMIHASDIADALVHSLTLFKPGHQFYLVKSQETFSLRHFIELYLKINGLKADLVWGKKEYNARHFFKDVTVHPILPGWQAKIKAQDGFKELF